ncbi:hypothetical protein NM208_g12516 [Fusarium decemcellulare]|uniref:Uncharacterized protein n=1 Tax=Fusarium decemcellulare TaxID=57161 RepID=A0ACC1RR08_9HYPO|nr:hypothetical protein NM208_g12516 [Fusarium decemcellulare]
MAVEPPSSERDETRFLAPIPSPYDQLPHRERLYKTLEICGKWPWQLVEPDKIPDSWSVNLLDEMAHAVRIVTGTADISLQDFMAQLDRIIEERIPCNKSNWSTKLMKTDVTYAIKWMTGKKKGRQKGRTTRSKSQASLPNNEEDQGAGEPRSTTDAGAELPTSDEVPLQDKPRTTGHDAQSSTVELRNDANQSQHDQNEVFDVQGFETDSATDQYTHDMSAYSPATSFDDERRPRFITSLAHADSATPSRKRPQLNDNSATEWTARKAHRGRRSDIGQRALADAPTLYMVWLRNESARAKQQVEAFNDCLFQLDSSRGKRAKVGDQEKQIQSERDAARRDVQKLAHDEHQHRQAVESLRPIVDQENCSAPYRAAFESSQKLLQSVPGDKKRAEERVPGEVERYRETVAQTEKEQRVCDVLLKLAGAGVAGIASWDSDRFVALEALVNEASGDEGGSEETGKESSGGQDEDVGMDG